MNTKDKGHCNGTYLNPLTNQHCQSCDKGYRVSNHCKEDNQKSTICTPCIEGKSFSNACDGATGCRPCSPGCRGTVNTGIVANCTRTLDVVCDCKKGSYMNPLGYCIAHKKCGIGEGVKVLGDRRKNTQCKECTLGSTYSNRSSSTAFCDNCSTCSLSAIKEACTLSKDAVCFPVTTVPPTSPTTRPLITKDPNMTLGLSVGGPISVGVVIIIFILLYIKCRKMFGGKKESAQSTDLEEHVVPKDVLTPEETQRLKSYEDTECKLRFRKGVCVNEARIKILEEQSGNTLDIEDVLAKGLSEYLQEHGDGGHCYKTIGEAISQGVSKKMALVFFEKNFCQPEDMLVQEYHSHDSIVKRNTTNGPGSGVSSTAIEVGNFIYSRQI
ncbi:uncharacterized protein LOC141899006 [Tubulanus polymorphus]|uniref:uncharacterized protein LOC141899006 n=1 Tax=Tubulanus polymorphus TaxID=672921 RepID=UPI003DA4B2B3